MDKIESTKYAVFNYGFVTEDGGLVISETSWATQAPIISPVFKTREEACEWLNSQDEENIESQREDTVTMNKSHMLYESGSQSEEAGQTVLGFVAIAIGAGAVAYGVYKIAEPLTTMLQNIP